MWRLLIHWPGSSAVRLELDAGEYAVGPDADADVYAPCVGVLQLDEQGAALATRDGTTLPLSAAPLQWQGATFTASKPQQATPVTRSLAEATSRAGELRLSHATLGEFKVTDRVLRIGTDTSNDVVLPSQYASKFHCELYEDKGTHWVRDLDSKNGTRVDDRRVSVAELSPPATLRVADEDFAVSRASLSGETLVHQAKASHALFERLRSLDRTKKLLVLAGAPGTGRRFFARVWHDLHHGTARPLHWRDATELTLDEVTACARHNATFVLVDFDLASADVREAVRDLAEQGRVQWLATSVAGAFAAQRGFTELVVPSLQQRLDDLTELAELFLSEASGTSGKRLADATRLWLRHHAPQWTARALRQLMTKAAAIDEHRDIHPADLGLAPKGLSSTEREAIAQALKANDHNMKRTAQALGIARSTLYRKLDEHGLRSSGA